jgi:hypothetical protein
MNVSNKALAQQYKQMRSRRIMAAMTPMTIPAMAPPLSPPPPFCGSAIGIVPFTPVAIGVWNGTVAVGEPVAAGEVPPPTSPQVPESWQ